MRKIFILSLHRTATRSTHHLLSQSGVDAVHWPVRHGAADLQEPTSGRELDSAFLVENLAPVLNAHEAFSDVPICALYEALAACYPDALHIALTRPAQDWVRSVRRHIGSRTLTPYEKALYWRYLPSRPDSIVAVSDAELIAMHRRHHDGLRSFFAESARFKLIELGDPQAGRIICDFIGLPRRDLPKIL